MLNTPNIQSLWPSTIAPAKFSTGRPPTRSSPNSYARSNSSVLHQPIELAQYTSIRYTEHLDLEGIAPSIGTVGDAFDNALMESVNGVYKTECIRTTVFHGGPFRTLADVEFATAGWVDWYNNRRLHGSLGMLTPIEFETLHYEALTREPEPAK